MYGIPLDTLVTITSPRVKNDQPPLLRPPTPSPVPEVHLAAALPDDAQDERVGDGGLDVEGLVVQRLQLLVILLRGVHLDLQRVHLQQLSTCVDR